MLVFKPAFIRHELIPIGILAVLYILQTGLALIRYGRMTSFHTYMAKIAAIAAMYKINRNGFTRLTAPNTKPTAKIRKATIIALVIALPTNPISISR